MVESFISRKAQTKFSVPGAHMLSDFKDIVRIGGWRGLFRGFTPYLLHSLISESEIGYDKPTMTIIKAQGIYASLMVLFGGPLTIHFTRMQNLDYPSQFRFLKGFSRMIATEGFTPLYRGSLGLLIGVLLQIPLTVASIVVFDLYTYKLSCFMAGIIISHPFYLLATRVMNAPLYRQGRDNRAFRNTITAFLYTWKTQGVSGFYRGFAPTLMFNCILWADYLRVMYKDGFCKDE
ncbi:hypothetical protein FGO68_gene10655 [Halteria grandinella]|uniref:Uncharacterized protein n=1 Tax=Halteria grandinella TaxID=5974 RepID=A0A8J8T0C6_HALGN|nr:hypothetical protein FGO68_gene10655 [Halteria grandinella]